MTVVKLFRIEDTENPIAVFDDGDHNIGRGILGDTCLTDRRISRRHGLLKITKDAVTLTAIHQNPCYYKTVTGDVKMLQMGESITLRNNDNFSCLKEDSWLKIVICYESQPVEDTTIPNTSIKRKNSFDNPGPSTNKITKIEYLTNSEVQSSTVLSLYYSTNDTVEPANNVLLDAHTIKMELVSDGEKQNSVAVDIGAVSAEKKEIKEEPKSLDNVIQPSSSPKPFEDNDGDEQEIKTENDEAPEQCSACKKDESSKNHKEKDTGVEDKDAQKPKRKWRDRCWYGKQCYRKNKEHKATFSHPGNSDYDTDPDDDRPSCSYGTACYRRNPAHRRDYKHPSNGGTAKPTLKPTRTKPKRQTNEDDDVEDEYDLEDPFINDDSEDDFQPEDDDTDSDLDDSQEIDEDTKQLIKEAKRITTKKGKKD